jgi:RNA polymerase sigma-70 factor (ECF subfamily)
MNLEGRGIEDPGAGNDMSVELSGDRIEDLAGGSGPEARLIEACRSGDEGAFNLLVWRWEKPLYNFIWKYTGDAALAEDLVQETFLRVLGSIRRYTHQGSFSTWLYRIAINLCKDHLKRRRLPMVSLHDFYTTASGERVYVQDRVADEGARTDEETEAGRRVELVRRLLDALPEEERVVILLKEYQDLTFREIAQTLGVPEGTVKSRLYHGLRGMKESLARSGITGRAALGGAL